jgi:hypothetical protein
MVSIRTATQNHKGVMKLKVKTSLKAGDGSHIDPNGDGAGLDPHGNP